MSDEAKPLPPIPDHLGSTTRRIVNGHDDTGKVIIQSDEELPLEAGPLWGLLSAPIWVTSETPSKDNNLPAGSDGATRKADRVNGLVSTKGTNCFAGLVAPGAGIPMHRTGSIDYIIIISGTMVNITDTGEEITMKAGDVLVQKGNRHAWKNPGPDWVKWVCVLIDADMKTGADGKAMAEGFA